MKNYYKEQAIFPLDFSEIQERKIAELFITGENQYWIDEAGNQIPLFSLSEQEIRRCISKLYYNRGELQKRYLGRYKSLLDFVYGGLFSYKKAMYDSNRWLKRQNLYKRLKELLN